MMILSANIQTALTTFPTQAFLLFRISTPANANISSKTTHYCNLTFGSDTYSSDCNIFDIDSPRISTNVDREQYKVTLADPAFLSGSYSERGMIGNFVTVRVGFLNPVTGLAWTTYEDTILTYRGRIDSTGYSIKTNEQGEALLQLTCSSPMSDLDLKKAMWLSRDFVRGRNSTDSSCDMIYSGSAALQLKWGKS